MRVALGVESGDPFIRQILGKSWADDDLRTMVADLKACDLGVSLLTLVGAGGTGLADTHVEKTVELVRSLALGDGDLVFLLDENELAAEGLGASDTDDLSGEAWSAQQARLRSALKSLRERGVKVLPYSLEKQWA
jgi:hypothetical protein